VRIGVSTPYRRLRFQPTVMARDLAASVEVLSAAIHGVHTNRLDVSEAERLVGVRGGRCRGRRSPRSPSKCWRKWTPWMNSAAG
jgi:hypothetical protein